MKQVIPFSATALLLLSGCVGMPSAVPSSEPATASAAALGGTPALDPQRTAPSVMKIWLAPWEDRSGALHGRSEVFVEVTGQRWTLRDAGATQPVLRPLQVEEQSETTAGTANDSADAPAGAAQRPTFAFPGQKRITGA